MSYPDQIKELLDNFDQAAKALLVAVRKEAKKSVSEYHSRAEQPQAEPAVVLREETSQPASPVKPATKKRQRKKKIPDQIPSGKAAGDLIGENPPIVSSPAHIEPEQVLPPATKPKAPKKLAEKCVGRLWLSPPVACPKEGNQERHDIAYPEKGNPKVEFCHACYTKFKTWKRKTYPPASKRAKADDENE